MIDVDPARRPPDPVGWVDQRRARTCGGAACRRAGSPWSPRRSCSPSPVVTAALLATRRRADGPVRAAGRVDRRARAAAPSAGPAASLGALHRRPGGRRPRHPRRLVLGRPGGAARQGLVAPRARRRGAPGRRVVTAPGGQVTYLTPTMWQSYSEITGATSPSTRPRTAATRSASTGTPTPTPSPSDSTRAA